MKDSLEFEDDEKKEAASNWQMGGVSQASFDTNASRVLNQQNLQLFHKKDTLSQRTIIPATLLEKLAYYRAFVSSPCKTNIISVQQIRFNRFLWRYIFNVLGKSLPSTYVYTFLSMYAPDEHFFIPKMIPICYGCVLSSICSAFFGLMIYTQALVISWDYVLHGLIYKNPWNRCAQSEYVSTTLTLACYNLTEFTRKIQNKTTIFEEFGYKIDSEPEKMFQMAPILYLRWRLKEILIPYTLCACEGAVVVAAALLYKQLFKRYIWMILNYCQWVLNLIYLATFTHLVIYYFNTGFHKVEVPIDEITHEIWDADIDMLAESMTGPPIVHILTARGTEKVRPSRHSSVIIASNAIYYIFRGLLSYMMKRYCENIVGVSVKITNLNPFMFYFFWPIYFSLFYLGDFYSITFFLLNAIMEFIVMVITFNCLVEAITQEWHFMKPWLICCIINLMTCFVSFFTDLNFRLIMYIFCTSVATLAEAIALFYLYPLGRLMDDVTFHYGTAPTTLRALSLRIVPIFYAAKVYTMLGVIIKILKGDNLAYQIELLYAQIVPFLLGGLFVIFKIVYRNRQGWKQLFVPVPEWGPKDFTERQLRKQFDSRQYIDSQASRDLSRYLIEKAELKTYKLDIQYDKASHHSKSQSEFLVEEEKKYS